MNIGSLEIKGHTVLAPLAGITHLPFRRLVKSLGCALVCSEMVSAKGLQYRSSATERLLDSADDERPLAVQIFGADPGAMAGAAVRIEAAGCADILDINFGCSVKKVVKTGAGVALMQDPAVARRVIRAVRQATGLPFTIKIRSGWDSSGAQAFEIARIAEDEGVDAITLHPRTARQGFGGNADWSLIRELKSRVSIPVIGNGDVVTPGDALRMMQETGCDAVMVGRAAMGNPFIFSGIEAALAGNESRDPSAHEIFQAMEALLNACVDYFGEGPACRMMRSRLGWFVKGYPGCSLFRRDLSSIESREQALGLIRAFGEQLSARIRQDQEAGRS